MSVSGIGHVTLVVADLGRAASFYQDVLGAEIRAESPRLVYLSLGPLWLCLEFGEPTPRGDDSHIAFGCEPADFERLSERIRRAATVWKDNRSEGRSVYFLDPDGHRLELSAGTLESRLAHYRAHPEKGVSVRD